MAVVINFFVFVVIIIIIILGHLDMWLGIGENWKVKHQ